MLKLLLCLTFVGICFANPYFETPVANSTYYAGTTLVITVANYNETTPFDLLLYNMNGDGTGVAYLVAADLPPSTTQYLYNIPSDTAEGSMYFVQMVYNCSSPKLCGTDSEKYFSILQSESGSSSDSDGISHLRIAEYIVGGAICGCVATIIVVSVVYAIRKRSRHNYSPIA